MDINGLHQQQPGQWRAWTWGARSDTEGKQMTAVVINSKYQCYTVVAGDKV